MGGTDPARGIHDELVGLERALALRDPSGIAGGLASLIAADFLEFGQSGRTWNATEINNFLGGATPAMVHLEIRDALVDLLADDVALVTYRLTVPGQPATNRSSVWIRRDGRWRLRFHQGTRVPDTPEGA